MSEKGKEMFEHSPECGRIPEIEKGCQAQCGGQPCLSPGKHFLCQVREKVHFQI